MSDSAPKGRLADLPLAERRRLEVETQRELDEGLTRRHVQNAAKHEAMLAANFARAVQFCKQHG
jgi:hypothetical protein